MEVGGVRPVSVATTDMFPMGVRSYRRFTTLKGNGVVLVIPSLL